MTNKFDPTKPVQTRDGRKARIVDTNLKSTSGSILAIVSEHFFAKEFSRVYYANGRYSRHDHEKTEVDLVNIPEKISGWLNIYDRTSSNYRFCGELYFSRTHANQEAAKDRIACIHIMCEEGEGL